MRLRRLRKVFLAFGLAVFLTAGTAAAAPILSENSHGHDVFKLQKKLKRAGYLADEPDGIFSSRTKSAVLAFQRAESLAETGVVDRETWSRLQRQPASDQKAEPKESAATPSSATTSNSAAAPAALPSQSDKIAFPGVKPADNTTAGAPGKEQSPTLEPRAQKVPESAPFLGRDKVASVIATAKKYIGTPYKFGGTTPKAFDCSGYLQYVFKEHGMMLPRTADEQFKLGKSARTSELEAGDLVFFETYEAGASHCDIYLGDGKFIHASTSKGVRIDELAGDYWKTHFYGAKHIVR